MRYEGAWFFAAAAPALIVAICPAGDYSQAASPPDGEARLTELQARFQTGLDTIRDKYELPGITAAFALPDGRVVAFATGLADKETGAKMTPDTRMPAGSIGKTFVSAMTLALVQDGKLSLDDKLEKWLGEEPWFAELPNGPQITVRHLLMHRAGLADHIYDPKWVAAVQQMVRALDTDPDYYFKPRDLVGYILGRKPLAPPVSSTSTPTPVTSCWAWSSSGPAARRTMRRSVHDSWNRSASSLPNRQITATSPIWPRATWRSRTPLDFPRRSLPTASWFTIL